jgi:hypothetical protein
VASLKGSLPQASIAPDVDHENIASSYVKNLASLNTNRLTENALWRDLWALTGTSRTFFGSGQIEAFGQNSRSVSPT